MSNFRQARSNLYKVSFKIIERFIIFSGIIFILYCAIIGIIFAAIIYREPELMDRPPAHEPKIRQSPILFADYLEGVSGDAPALSYEGRTIKTLCIATTYQYPDRKGLRYSQYIQGW
ncbi:hypothetical protein, partial [Elstera litoralis]|uniref:hypothetical protein n=1 Tax=Elstera litoralis TaxID=552518 RepID=UPI001E382E8D